MGSEDSCPGCPIFGQTDQVTRIGQWDERSFVEATLLTNQPINLYHEYQKTFTLTGAEEDLDLNIDYPFELQRINLRFSDNSEKTFSVDVYGQLSGNGNANIMSYSNHYNDSYENTDKRIFLHPRLIRISIEERSTLLKKTLEATIVTRELPLYRGRGQVSKKNNVYDIPTMKTMGKSEGINGVVISRNIGNGIEMDVV